MSDLGSYIKKLRGNMSLREASRRSGLSYSYISSLESGKHPRTGESITPSPETLKSLSTAYNCDYEELMRLAGHSDLTKEQQEKHSNMMTAVEKDLLSKFKDIPKEDQEMIKMQLDHLYRKHLKEQQEK